MIPLVSSFIFLTYEIKTWWACVETRSFHKGGAYWYNFKASKACIRLILGEETLPKPGGRKMSIRMKNAPVPQESVFKKVMNRIRRVSGNSKDILVEKIKVQIARTNRKRHKFQRRGLNHLISYQKSRKNSRTKLRWVLPIRELLLRPAGRDLLRIPFWKNRINKISFLNVSPSYIIKHIKYSFYVLSLWTEIFSSMIFWCFTSHFDNYFCDSWRCMRQNRLVNSYRRHFALQSCCWADNLNMNRSHSSVLSRTSAAACGE